MKLNDFLFTLKDICSRHIDVKTVQVGDSYDVANSINDSFPLVFIELPAMINKTGNGNETIKLAISTYCKPSYDDSSDDNINSCSDAKQINDELIEYIYQNYSQLYAVQSTELITLTEFSDNDVAGVRNEITFVINEDCVVNVDQKFDLESNYNY